MNGDGSDPDVDWARYRDQRITQPLMIAFMMIVRDVLGHGLPEVPLAERNDAIETLLFDGPDEALSEAVSLGA